jgi:hypothetical protein
MEYYFKVVVTDKQFLFFTVTVASAVSVVSGQDGGEKVRFAADADLKGMHRELGFLQDVCVNFAMYVHQAPASYLNVFV